MGVSATQSRGARSPLSTSPADDVGVEGLLAQDPTACAPGELLYDLCSSRKRRRHGRPRSRHGLIAVHFDRTGSYFVFSNTTPRAHSDRCRPAAARCRSRRDVSADLLRPCRYAGFNCCAPHSTASMSKKRTAWPGSRFACDDDRVQCDVGRSRCMVEHARSIAGSHVAILCSVKPRTAAPRSHCEQR